VFNLLSNATDALKRRAMGEGDFGAALWVSTRSQPGEFGMSLAVRDNGLGIRNRQGELADAEEIRDIFQTGFTSKKESLAEGLGLNWVKQIIHEFHRGQLSARNHPEGGAEVTMLMPRFDTPPGQHGYGDDETTDEQAKDKNTPHGAEVKS
jgi:two-component system sensor histidine kinase HupT/HoxJ